MVLFLYDRQIRISNSWKSQNSRCHLVGVNRFFCVKICLRNIFLHIKCPLGDFSKRNSCLSISCSSILQSLYHFVALYLGNLRVLLYWEQLHWMPENFPMLLKVSWLKSIMQIFGFLFNMENSFYFFFLI